MKSRLTGTLAAPTSSDYAVILHPLLRNPDGTPREVGGHALAASADTVTINYAGQRVTGTVVRFLGRTDGGKPVRADLIDYAVSP